MGEPCNVHNKAYTYRMLTYAAALSSVSFDVGGNDVEFYPAAVFKTEA